jgi:hypothetical protein
MNSRRLKDCTPFLSQAVAALAGVLLQHSADIPHHLTAFAASERLADNEAQESPRVGRSVKRVLISAEPAMPANCGGTRTQHLKPGKFQFSRDPVGAEPHNPFPGNAADEASTS